MPPRANQAAAEGVAAETWLPLVVRSGGKPGGVSSRCLPSCAIDRGGAKPCEVLLSRLLDWGCPAWPACCGSCKGDAVARADPGTLPTADAPFCIDLARGYGSSSLVGASRTYAFHRAGADTSLTTGTKRRLKHGQQFCPRGNSHCSVRSAIEKAIAGNCAGTAPPFSIDSCPRVLHRVVLPRPVATVP